MLLSKYRHKYHMDFVMKKDFSDCVQSIDEASQLIYSLLTRPEPCMISRFGSVELMAMTNYMKGKHPFWFMRSVLPFWAKKSVAMEMRRNAGFFSNDNYNMCRFADLLYDSAKQTDILGAWLENEKAIEGDMSYRKCVITHLEPWFASKPWTKALEDKDIVVIHPFAETIARQYEKRDMLFDNPDMLPTFKSLRIVKAVQTIGGSDAGFSSWFDALEYMEKEIDSQDYDIALIGCGAYGMPLAAHCKKKGKKAVHLGGALQLLFGIRGRRWETEYPEEYRKMLSNPYWVRPTIAEMPTTAQQVEKGCYW